MKNLERACFILFDDVSSLLFRSIVSFLFFIFFCFQVPPSFSILLFLCTVFLIRGMTVAFEIETQRTSGRAGASAAQQAYAEDRTRECPARRSRSLVCRSRRRVSQSARHPARQAGRESVGPSQQPIWRIKRRTCVTVGFATCGSKHAKASASVGVQAFRRTDILEKS